MSDIREDIAYRLERIEAHTGYCENCDRYIRVGVILVGEDLNEWVVGRDCAETLLGLETQHIVKKQGGYRNLLNRVWKAHRRVTVQKWEYQEGKVQIAWLERKKRLRTKSEVIDANDYEVYLRESMNTMAELHPEIIFDDKTRN
jgi:hypothetical protein